MPQSAAYRTTTVLMPTAPPPPAKRSVPELIQDLLSGLAGLGLRKGSGTLKRSVRRYRDADFNYMEVVLPGLEGVEADICIHDGCIYVRSVR